LQPLVTDSSPIDILRLSALIDAQVGDLQSALTKAERVLERNPADNYLFFKLGKVALTQSQPEFGDRLVWLGRKVGAGEAKVSVLEGRIALRRRNFQKAEACFHKAVSSPIRDPWGYFYLGKTCMRMGDLSKAIDVLYEGEEYMMKNPQLRTGARDAIKNLLGIAYVRNGDIEAAGHLLEGSLEKDPDNPETLYAYWLYRVRKDGIEKASEAFEVFRRAKPKRWEKGNYHLYYGLFLKALGDLPAANEQFASARKHAPNDVFIMIQYAENLYKLALQAKLDADGELSNDRAVKCANIIRRIFDFDPDNSIAADLQVNLYLEFGLELSEVEKMGL
jgi:tetratricopeptide (TPR) repeat protein